jgi:hypothetical protein
VVRQVAEVRAADQTEQPGSQKVALHHTKKRLRFFSAQMDRVDSEPS